MMYFMLYVVCVVKCTVKVLWTNLSLLLSPVSSSPQTLMAGIQITSFIFISSVLILAQVGRSVLSLWVRMSIIIMCIDRNLNPKAHSSHLYSLTNVFLCFSWSWYLLYRDASDSNSSDRLLCADSLYIHHLQFWGQT